MFYLHAASSQNHVAIKEKTNASTATETEEPAVEALTRTHNNNNHTYNHKTLLPELIRKTKEHRWLFVFLLFCLLSSGILAIAIVVGDTSSSFNTTELSNFSSSADVGTHTFNENDVTHTNYDIMDTNFSSIDTITNTTMDATTDTTMDATTDTTPDAPPSTASILKIATIAAFVFLGLLLCLQLIDWYLGGAAAAVRHAWNRFTGAEDSEGLFHTQPYYLAVTRSTCEVILRSSLFFSSRL